MAAGHLDRNRWEKGNFSVMSEEQRNKEVVRKIEEAWNKNTVARARPVL